MNPDVISRLNRFPRQQLAFAPTPLVELKRLSQFLGGPRIWMKRDDQTGLALGGNKVRKLEFLVGDALAQGADVLVTGGAAQSNHCRQTAAAAAVAGLECHLALGGEAPYAVNGNLLLDQLLGAHIHWSGERRKGENLSQICAQLREEGKTPYVLPYGGSSPVGALGYVEAMRELDAQLFDKGEAVSHMVFASSSGGTHAGMMLGKRILEGDYTLIGIKIDKESESERPFEDVVLDLANETAAMLGMAHVFSGQDVLLQADYVGEGYGVMGAPEREAITLLARLEGVLLDPVYTGRAMAGLMGMIRSGELGAQDEVLFWHTGGAPALFAQAGELSEYPF